jgi:hypothetical protein
VLAEAERFSRVMGLICLPDSIIAGGSWSGTASAVLAWLNTLILNSMSAGMTPGDYCGADADEFCGTDVSCAKMTFANVLA